jgi:hypothetical protein
VGLVILSTANRFHHVNNLIRGYPENGDREYLRMLLRRSQYFHKALTSLYVSMGAFAVSALLGNLGLYIFEGHVIWIYLTSLLTTLGVGAFVYCSVKLMQESALSFRLIRKFDRHGGD